MATGATGRRDASCQGRRLSPRKAKWSIQLEIIRRYLFQ
ncbi:hypothetical protein B481_0915 [Planococcus halocryophilus Or1]|nr:hypothetical protein B481_0915 [Planococcus halocryophilus Or1]